MDRRALAQAITLIESTRPEDRVKADTLLETLTLPPHPHFSDWCLRRSWRREVYFY